MSGFTPIDLSKLDPPSIAPDVEFEATLTRFKAYMGIHAPELDASLDYESDPIVKFIQLLAYEGMWQANNTNLGVRAELVAFASGADLDHLAANIPLARLPDETDAAFRPRVQLAPEGFSVNGSVGSYEFHTRSVDVRIVDVSVTSPAPVEVDIAVLVASGVSEADEALIFTAIEERFAIGVQENDVRPLTDQVSFRAATRVGFDLEAVLSIGTGPDPDLILAAAQDRASAYLEERRQLGTLVALSGLTAALHAPGVETVDLIAPAADITPANDAYAEADSIDITRVAS